MINDVEHLFMSIGHLCVLSGEISMWVLCPFLSNNITLKTMFFLAYLKYCSKYEFFKVNIYFLTSVCLTSAESNFSVVLDLSCLAIMVSV